MPKFDVAVAGELNLDLILYGLPDELPPERELLADRMMLTMGGSSSIFAHNLAALGSRVLFQSRIGDDDLGRAAVKYLHEIGVDVSGIRRVPGEIKTGLTVVLQRQAWRNMVTYSGTIAELTWDDLDFKALSDARHFHMSSFYLQRGLRPRAAELFRKMKEAGLTTSLDTNDDPDDRWEGGLRETLQYVDVFLPNEREAQKAAGVQDLETATKKLADIVPLVVVKVGKHGAIAQRGSERFSAPPVKVDAIDAVGAGDSFDAGFLHHYIRGATIPECLRAGNIVGAFSTTRPGGAEAFRETAYREDFFKRNQIQT